MTPKEGIAKLRGLLGPSAGHREYKFRSSPEFRAAAIAERDRLGPLLADANAALDQRRRELLADPEYQRLKAETVELRKAIAQARGDSVFYRLSVGTHDSMFFHVEARGDNWADVIQNLEAKRERDRQEREARSHA